MDHSPLFAARSSGAHQRGNRNQRNAAPPEIGREARDALVRVGQSGGETHRNAILSRE